MTVHVTTRACDHRLKLIIPVRRVERHGCRAAGAERAAFGRTDPS